MDATDLERWRTADLEFERLLGVSGAERRRRLDELARADLLLCERVRGMLQAHASAGGVLDRARAPLLEVARDALSGRQLGRWRLEHEIGRGGMSVVYRAHAVEGAPGRDAAIKILTLGTLAGDGGRRFVREQSVLVRLRHPYIVPLYDAGVADDGTPWLAMARIEGVPIDAWCDVRGLETRARIRLLLQVCEAVAHAHRNLVIHRDIKPSNVLVDDDGCVRLLDFGIAAQMDPGTERTATVLRALTPDYAAPEQFDGAPAATTMDVYGIGALGYCVLTGAPPARAAAAAALAVASPRPVRGDLEAIMRKATADEADDRYPSVDALAEDLQRWLGGRPVHARPPRLTYRLRRFVARNRLLVAASAALVLAVGGGIGATVWQARQAQKEAERAVATRDFLVHILESADPTNTRGRDPPASELLRTGAQQIQAELAHRPALRADLLLVIGKTQLARGLVNDAAASLDQAMALFTGGQVVDDRAFAATLSTRAMVSYEQGALAAAVAQLERADALLAKVERDGGYSPQREETRSSLADLMAVAQHRTAEAGAIARDLVEHLRRSGRTGSIEYPRSLRTLGAVADLEGRSEEAIDWLLQALEAMRLHPDAEHEQATLENELGIVYVSLGRLDDARNALQRALEIQRRLFGELHPTTLNSRGNLAVVQLRDGHAGEAAAEFERILALKHEMLGTELHPDVIADLGWLALAHYQDGRLAAARARADQGWAIAQQLPAEDRTSVNWLASLAGLLRMELDEPDPDGLLHHDALDCDQPSTGLALARWVCTARAWRPRDNDGSCRLAGAQPSGPAAPGDRVDPRWRAAYWVMHARCGGPGAFAEAEQAIGGLLDAAVPLPEWLEQQLLQAGLQQVH